MRCYQQIECILLQFIGMCAIKCVIFEREKKIRCIPVQRICTQLFMTYEKEHFQTHCVTIDGWFMTFYVQKHFDFSSFRFMLCFFFRYLDRMRRMNNIWILNKFKHIFCHTQWSWQFRFAFLLALILFVCLLKKCEDK